MRQFIVLLTGFLVLANAAMDLEFIQNQLHNHLKKLNMDVPVANRPFDHARLSQVASPSRSQIKKMSSSQMMAYKMREDFSCNSEKPYVYVYGFYLDECFGLFESESYAYSESGDVQGSFKYECAGGKRKIYLRFNVFE